MGLFDNNLFFFLALYGIVAGIALWIGMVIWAYRDMRSRSRDALLQIFVAVVVALLNLAGLIVYILMRPRETLSEAYERSLEEEALLQEIEEKPTCPGCIQRVREDWQVCPHCHTRLKKPCVHCNHLLELAWKICPYCATDQNTVTAPMRETPQYVPQQYTSEPPPNIPDKWLAQDQPRNADIDYPRYVDDEY